MIQITTYINMIGNYVWGNHVARSRNVYTSTAILTTWFYFTRRELLWRFNVASKNTKHLGLQVKWQTLYQKLDFVDRFAKKKKNPQYRVSWKSVQWGRRYSVAMDWTIRGSKRGRGEVFRVRPDRPQGPPKFLWNGNCVSSAEVKRPGRSVDQPPLLALSLKNR